MPERVGMTPTNTGHDEDFSTWTKDRWLVLSRENDAWMPVASNSDTLADAEHKRTRLLERRLPGADLRIVRETTTYTVEEQP